MFGSVCLVLGNESMFPTLPTRLDIPIGLPKRRRTRPDVGEGTNHLHHDVDIESCIRLRAVAAAFRSNHCPCFDTRIDVLDECTADTQPDIVDLLSDIKRTVPGLLERHESEHPTCRFVLPVESVDCVGHECILLAYEPRVKVGSVKIALVVSATGEWTDVDDLAG